MRTAGSATVCAIATLSVYTRHDPPGRHMRTTGDAAVSESTAPRPFGRFLRESAPRCSREAVERKARLTETRAHPLGRLLPDRIGESRPGIRVMWSQGGV